MEHVHAYLLVVHDGERSGRGDNQLKFLLIKDLDPGQKYFN